MEFTSTRNNSLSVSSAQAILQGLSEEGGLFVPRQFPQVDLAEACRLDYCRLARLVLEGFLSDYDPAFLGQAAEQVYGANFGGKAGQLSKVIVQPSLFDLHHGTLAFDHHGIDRCVCFRKANISQIRLVRFDGAELIGQMLDLQSVRTLRRADLETSVHPRGDSIQIDRIAVEQHNGSTRNGRVGSIDKSAPNRSFGGSRCTG